MTSGFRGFAEVTLIGESFAGSGPNAYYHEHRN
jgi:hypothetical protein